MSKIGYEVPDDVVKDVSLAGDEIALDSANVLNDVLRLQDYLGIDDTDLSGEYMRQAAHFGYIGVRQTQAEYAASLAKAELERIQARLDKDYRRYHDERNEKFTEPSIKADIARDSTYIAANTRYMRLQYHADILKVLVNAMKQRAEMLISLGAHTRMEANMEGMTLRDDNMVADAKSKIKAMRRQV